jgi:hypothetical protein
MSCAKAEIRTEFKALPLCQAVRYESVGAVWPMNLKRRKIYELREEFHFRSCFWGKSFLPSAKSPSSLSVSLSSTAGSRLALYAGVDLSVIE